MRILRSSLLTSLLVVVKGSSLNEAMAKIKNDAGFEPKEPRKHKTDTKVGLHLDNLLAVSAPPSAPSTYLRTAHPQHNRLSTPAAPSAPSPSARSAHPQHPQHTPSAPSAPFSSCTCWDSEPSAMTPRQYSDYRVDENGIACPLLAGWCHRWRRGEVDRLQHRYICILAF